MNTRINIDILGGASVLAICSYFFLQISDDFSPFGLYFPERMLPILAAFGAAILAKGFIHPTRLEKPAFRHVNGSMLVAVAAGLAWVVLLEPAGFLVSSFLGVYGLQLAYLPKEKRTPKGIVLNAIGSLAVVAFFNWVFVQYLGVTLPKGILG